jgi:hypothetical protein
MAGPIEQFPPVGPRIPAASASGKPTPAPGAAVARAPGPARRPVRRRVMAAPPPSAERALATRAREVIAAREGGCPFRWLQPGFARDVDLVRRQLGPLRDRPMLVASYEREGARLAALRRLAADPAAPPLPLGPLEAAYAVRWIELAGGGQALPSWVALVGGAAVAPASPGPTAD